MPFPAEPGAAAGAAPSDGARLARLGQGSRTGPAGLRGLLVAASTAAGIVLAVALLGTISGWSGSGG